MRARSVLSSGMNPSGAQHLRRRPRRRVSCRLRVRRAAESCGDEEVEGRRLPIPNGRSDPRAQPRSGDMAARCAARTPLASAGAVRPPTNIPSRCMGPVTSSPSGIAHRVARKEAAASVNRRLLAQRRPAPASVRLLHPSSRPGANNKSSVSIARLRRAHGGGHATPTTRRERQTNAASLLHSLSGGLFMKIS